MCNDYTVCEFHIDAKLFVSFHIIHTANHFKIIIMCSSLLTPIFNKMYIIYKFSRKKLALVILTAKYEIQIKEYA